jgi:hypothetical protein
MFQDYTQHNLRNPQPLLLNTDNNLWIVPRMD